ncbi:MAG: hypothetical protein J0H67_13435 [Rhodospirillales bacterium]|nr:hypothetical protein [Rhodospirillales bacterium]
MMRSALCLVLLLSSLGGQAVAAESRSKQPSPTHHRHRPHTPAKPPPKKVAPSPPATPQAAPGPPEAPQPPPIGELRTEVAAIADALTTLQQDVRGLVDRTASDSTQTKLQAAAQLRQATLLGAQLEALANRVDAVDRDRRLDQGVLERRIGAEEARSQAQEQRLAALAAERTNAPAMVAMGLGLVGILIGIAALAVAFRIRYAAQRAAERASDRLFRVYRLEFEAVADRAGAFGGAPAHAPGPADADPRKVEPIRREPSAFDARFPTA